jgi:hypothetical protein
VLCDGVCGYFSSLCLLSHRQLLFSTLIVDSKMEFFLEVTGALALPT